jgi:hypothetical protein
MEFQMKWNKNTLDRICIMMPLYETFMLHTYNGVVDKQVKSNSRNLIQCDMIWHCQYCLVTC